MVQFLLLSPFLRLYFIIIIQYKLDNEFSLCISVLPVMRFLAIGSANDLFSILFITLI